MASIIDSERLRAFQEVPTLIITGSGNQAFLGEATRFHSEIPGSDLTIIDGSGPQINMEAPDRFNAEVRAFVKRASGYMN